MIGAVDIGGAESVMVPLTMPSDAVDGVDHVVNLALVNPSGAPVPHATVRLSLTTDSRNQFTVTSTPRFTGSAHEGQWITVLTGPWDPAATLTVAWYRDGKLVPGLTGFSHRATSADVGHRLSATVTGSNPLYIPVSLSTSSSAMIQSASPATLAAGTKLAAGAKLVSVTPTYAFLARTNGSVAIVNRYTGKTVWSTARVGATSVALWKTGELVATNAKGKPVWRSHTAGKGITRAVLSSGGKLLLQNARQATKWTNVGHK